MRSKLAEVCALSPDDHSEFTQWHESVGKSWGPKTQAFTDAVSYLKPRYPDSEESPGENDDPWMPGEGQPLDGSVGDVGVDLAIQPHAPDQA